MKGNLHRKKHFRLWHLPILLVGILIAGGVILIVLISSQPAFGAAGADFLRSVIGDKAVAGLEMAYNQVVDAYQTIKFRLGFSTPGTGWEILPTSTPNLEISDIGTPHLSTSIVQPETTGFPYWPPQNLSPISGMIGEGLWDVYIQDASGNSVAYRTFIQPDPNRPFAPVAIVAFDLMKTRFHFILGTISPVIPGGPHGKGEIPPVDLDQNALLATFNGGFKATHGEFGAMADGITALPARDGLGTLVLYQNGSLRLGEWGKDVWMTDDIESFRQNGPLVVQDGKINPRIYNNDPLDWGYTIIDVSPTVRSGIGINPDDSILYYFCGPGLDMEGLARVMVAAGVRSAIQLDINKYWVLFTKILPYGKGIMAEPLFPQWMTNVNRFILTSARDFFYVTSFIDD